VLLGDHVEPMIHATGGADGAHVAHVGIVAAACADRRIEMTRENMNAFEQQLVADGSYYIFTCASDGEVCRIAYDGREYVVDGAGEYSKFVYGALG
jgi:hypothetical protein